MAKPNVLIIGGSIGGLSAGLALKQAGCNITILERSTGSSHPSGAGLSMDLFTHILMQELGLGGQYNSISRSIPIEEYRWIPRTRSADERQANILITNQTHLHRSALWKDLHGIFFEALPAGTVRYGHKVVAFEQSEDGVAATAEVRTPDGCTETQTFRGDILVAADGSQSFVRSKLVPGEQRRYSGMIAWRGVVEMDQHPELLQRLAADYRSLTRGVTFDIADRCMALVEMIPGNRINWLWYKDAPEPDIAGHSVTVKPTAADLAALHQEAEETWTPAFADLIKATPAPFINAIHDKDPIEHWAFGRIVLLGEAAHPTTPHGFRSTNMSMQDAGALGQCVRAWKKDLPRALKEYELMRVPQTAKDVLFSRHIGEVRQGRWFDPVAFNWPEQEAATKELLMNAKRNLKDYKAVVVAQLAGASPLTVVPAG